MAITIIDKSAAYMRRVEAAADLALNTTTLDLASIMIQSLQTSIKVPDGTPTSRQPSSPPGTPPASKSAAGGLAGRIVNAKVGNLKWATGTDIVYARIQEFGGTINHPGGTAYKIVGPGRARFVKNIDAQPWTKRTRAHTITLPPRPYMRPALNNNMDRLGRVFRAAFKNSMGAA